MPLVHLGAILFFALLVLFDFKVAFHQTGGPVNLFGLSGLAVGDTVIVEGHQALAHDARVFVKD